MNKTKAYFRTITAMKIGLFLLCLCFGEFSLVFPAMAQLNEVCTANARNRSVRVKSDGTFAIPGIPADQGLFRVRVACVRNGTTLIGQSRFLAPVPNGATVVGDIIFEQAEPTPESIIITGPTAPIAAGDNFQLTVTANFTGGTSDVTASATGTSYTTSNPNIATVSEDGLITALGSGRAIISARNDGTLSTIFVNVGGGGDTDGDGLRDGVEVAFNLDPKVSIFRIGWVFPKPLIPRGKP